MKPTFNVFSKVLVALLVIGVLPVSIASLLIVSAQQEAMESLIQRVYQDDPQHLTSERDYIDQLNQDNTILITIIICISILLCLFLAVYLTKIFVLPLQRVTLAAQMIGRGDLSVRLATDRRDEFGRLANGFNTMAKALAKAQEQLKRANAELEQRVAERTAELSFMNNELRKTAEKIHESSRLKSEFLANMSHELRTPLNAILGYSDLMLEGIYGPLQASQRESVDKIRKNSEMLLRLINDLLDLSRLEAGRMPVAAESFDPGELGEQTVSNVRPLFEKKGLALSVDIPSPPPRMNSDPGKIQQVLLNLLSNALKFTDEGEVVLSIKGSQDDRSVVFTVSDTGIGIAPEHLNLIFDQFRQLDGSTSRQYGGTGLGLSISKKIVSVLDGEIQVVSSPGKGSSFILTIPRVYGETRPAKRRLADDESGERVIVAIDDDADVLHLLSDSLKSEGFQVVGCLDSEEGVRRVKDLLPFAVTLDIMMPYRDGWSVLRELKSNPRTRDIPVIIISIIDDRPRGYQLGVDDYIVKPIKHRELLHALKSFESEHRVH